MYDPSQLQKAAGAKRKAELKSAGR